VLFQPIAADDVASAVARVAVGSPLNGTIEIGGPEQFRFDDLIREIRFADWLKRSASQPPNANLPSTGPQITSKGVAR